MRVEAIKEVARAFATALKSGRYILDYDIAYTSISSWQSSFRLQSDDLVAMFEKSLHNPDTARLWGGSTNSMKSSMLALLNYDSDATMLALIDLLNENKDLSLRLGRFDVYTQEIYHRMAHNDKRAEPLRQGRYAAFLYLMHAYPDKYCLFQYDDFVTMLHQCGSTKIPTIHETERYAKICKTIFTLVIKEKDVIDTYMKAAQNCDAVYLVLLNDVMRFCASR